MATELRVSDREGRARFLRKRGLGHLSLERSVIREESAERLIDRGDVRLITGEGRPPERSDALAEQRPDIGRDEARVCERLLYAARIGLTS